MSEHGRGGPPGGNGSRPLGSGPWATEASGVSSGGEIEPPAPTNELERRVVEALRQVRDPEIPVNIYDLGLIYALGSLPDGEVYVRMTLTAPSCPVAPMIVREVEEKVRAVDGVTKAVVELVFEPPWSRERMTEVARFELGFEV